MKKKDLILTSVSLGLGLCLSLAAFIVYEVDQSKTTATVMDSTVYSQISNPSLFEEQLEKKTGIASSEMSLENSNTIKTNQNGEILNLDLSLFGSDNTNMYAIDIQREKNGSYWLKKEETGTKVPGPSFCSALKCISLWDTHIAGTKDEWTFFFQNAIVLNPIINQGTSYLLKEAKLIPLTENLQGGFSSITVSFTLGSFYTIYY